MVLPTPGSENYDPIIAGKAAFLNMPFFYRHAGSVVRSLQLFWLGIG
jgi:hypothetical protein